MPFSFSLNLGILKKERENVLHICLHMLVFSFTKYISIFSFVQYLMPTFMITTTFKTLFPVLDVYQAFSIIIIYVCLYFLFSLEITENKLPRLHHDKGLCPATFACVSVIFSFCLGTTDKKLAHS